MNERVKELRKTLKISQDSFSSKINISRSHYALIEGGSKTLTDRVVSDICREFNVNEDWLRTGTGEMFVEPDTFSLDEYVKQRGATDFELSLVQTFVKNYFGLPEETRDQIITDFKNTVLLSIRNGESVATKGENTKNSIDEEVAAFKSEIEAESKGATLSALEKLEGA